MKKIVQNINKTSDKEKDNNLVISKGNYNYTIEDIYEIIDIFLTALLLYSEVSSDNIRIRKSIADLKTNIFPGLLESKGILDYLNYSDFKEIYRDEINEKKLLLEKFDTGNCYFIFDLLFTQLSLNNKGEEGDEKIKKILTNLKIFTISKETKTEATEIMEENETPSPEELILTTTFKIIKKIGKLTILRGGKDEFFYRIGDNSSVNIIDLDNGFDFLDKEGGKNNLKIIGGKIIISGANNHTLNFDKQGEVNLLLKHVLVKDAGRIKIIKDNNNNNFFYFIDNKKIIKKIDKKRGAYFNGKNKEGKKVSFKILIVGEEGNEEVIVKRKKYEIFK